MRVLTWRPEGVWPRVWDLLEGDRQLARLHAPFWPGEARLLTDGTTWTIERRGAFHVVLDATGPPGAIAARASLAWDGANLVELVPGGAYRWEPRGLLRRELTLRAAESGRVVATLHRRSWWWVDAAVEVSPEAPTDEALVLLLGLGWLAYVLRARAAASTP